MTDAEDEQRDEQTNESTDQTSVQDLRERVEQKYDFDEFGPAEMAEMTPEEWDVAFDDDAWVTGAALLERVEADLKHRVENREVFAVIEREGDQRVIAYSDEGYAVVYADGTVEGRGTVLRDVKPTVALTSMPDYDVPDMPEGDGLPDPASVPEGSGELGNKMVQVIAGAHVLAGIVLFFAWIGLALPAVAAVASFGFLGFGAFLFLIVANARLSDRFRAEEYRNRLRAIGLAEEEDIDIPEPVSRNEPESDSRRIQTENGTE